MENLESTTADESRDGLLEATHLEESIAGTNGKRPAEVESALTNSKKPKLSDGSDIHGSLVHNRSQCSNACPTLARIPNII